jgi:AcrR family transcriptional regulator
MTPRQREIVHAARAIIESDGGEALTMQRLAASLGIRAPSLYKHFQDKSAVETALAIEALTEQADILEGAGADLGALAVAYRSWALAHPHLHLFLNKRPLPREQLPVGLEDRAAATLLLATGGDRDLARAAWAAINGLVDLELAERLPHDADVDAAYAATVGAFSLAVQAGYPLEKGVASR